MRLPVRSGGEDYDIASHLSRPASERELSAGMSQHCGAVRPGPHGANEASP